MNLSSYRERLQDKRNFRLTCGVLSFFFFIFIITSFALLLLPSDDEIECRISRTKYRSTRKVFALMLRLLMLKKNIIYGDLSAR